MKNLTKQEICVAVLFLLLAWSVFLNLLQGGRIEALITKIDQLEEIQQALSNQISELETVKYYDSYETPEEP